MSKTTLGSLHAGDRVNLERSLRPIDRMGGHFVQGHVDAVATVAAVRTFSGGRLVTVRIPERLTKYVISEGSVALDGVSLTVARLHGAEATVALIPHTLERTTFASIRQGSLVNLEVDLIGKYVERILTHSDKGQMTSEWLQKMGYNIRQDSSGYV